MKGKHLRIAGLILTGVVVLLLITAYGAIKIYNYNRFKPKIERAVQEATHRTLDMAGDIQVGLFPKPTLQAEDIRLQNAPWGTRLQLLTVKRIEVQVNWRALLRGKIKIDRVVFVEPDILLETDKKGQFNWPSVVPVQGEAQSAALPGWFAGEFIIRKGVLSFKNGPEGSLQRFPIKRLFAEIRDPSPRIYEVKTLELDAGDTRINGTFRMDMSGKRPHVTAKITCPEADTAVLFDRETAAQKEKDSASSKLFSDDPLDFSVLDQVDGDVSFSTDRLVFPWGRLQQFELHARLEQGHLQVKPVTGRMAGGEIDTGVDIQTEEAWARIGSRLTANDLSLSKMDIAAPQTGPLEGDIDLLLDVTGTGRSMASFMATLNGKAEIRMRDGRIANPYIKKLDVFGTDFSTGVFRLLNPSEKQTRETVIHCFVCRFDIRQGVVHSEAMVFNTPQMVVVADGKANLKTEKLDFSFKPSPKKGIGIKGLDQINLSLNDLTRPFKLGGTLTHPSLTVDPAQSALIIGKALGGAALFGPVGIAAVLLSGDVAGHENPCLAAIEAAKKKGAEAATQEGASDEPETDKRTEKGDDQFVNEVVGQ